MVKIFGIILAFFLFSNGFSQEPTRWRGPSGDGKYPETGLLKKWPNGGPEIIWSYENLGQGHSSVTSSNRFLYVTGMIDGNGNLFKFNQSGKLIYKIPYGPEFTESWFGTRGTPVIVRDKIYLVSGHGKLVCFNEADGTIVWSRELFKEFDGSNVQWGMNETPVVDGEIIYVTPGGKKNNMVALNRLTGKLIWSSPGNGEKSGYCTPALFEHNGRKILATHTEAHLIGLDAATGKMLWKQSHPNEWSVHPNTPIYHEGSLFCFSGYGQGGEMLKLNQDGSDVTLTWTTKTLDSRIGGAVLVDGYIYASGDNNRAWQCLEWKTGKVMYSSEEIGKGAVIYADGMLYCYSERGELALVKADPAGFQVLSKTRVTLGTEQHWAHPVIHDGVLYVRHGNALIAYNIKN